MSSPWRGGVGVKRWKSRARGGQGAESMDLKAECHRREEEMTHLRPPKKPTPPKCFVHPNCTAVAFAYTLPNPSFWRRVKQNKDASHDFKNISKNGGIGSSSIQLRWATGSQTTHLLKTMETVCFPCWAPSRCCKMKRQLAVRLLHYAKISAVAFSSPSASPEMCSQGSECLVKFLWNSQIDLLVHFERKRCSLVLPVNLPSCQKPVSQMQRQNRFGAREQTKKERFWICKNSLSIQSAIELSMTPHVAIKARSFFYFHTCKVGLVGGGWQDLHPSLYPCFIFPRLGTRVTMLVSGSENMRVSPMSY